MKHETGKDDQMQASKRAWKSLVIAYEASKTGCPSKRALNYPSARQQDKATLGFGMFDHFQTNAMFFCGFRWNIAGIALVHESHFDMTPGDAPGWLEPARLPGPDLVHWQVSPTGSADCQAYRRQHALCFLCGAWLRHSLRGLHFRESIAGFGCPKWPLKAGDCALWLLEATSADRPPER